MMSIFNKKTPPEDITLIRHGTSKHNKEGWVPGQLDSPLTKEGQEEARQLGISLSEIHQHHPYDIIISSDLSRSLETAMIIQEELTKYRHLPIYTDERLRERDVGSWEEKTMEEIKDSGELGERGSEHRYQHQLGGGESLSDVDQRMAKILEEVVDEYPEKRILLVSHKEALGELALRLEKRDPYQGAEMREKPYRDPDLQRGEALCYAITINDQGKVEGVLQNHSQSDQPTQ